jgi:hypothetical protein
VWLTIFPQAMLCHKSNRSSGNRFTGWSLSLRAGTWCFSSLRHVRAYHLGDCLPQRCTLLKRHAVGGEMPRSDRAEERTFWFFCSAQLK